MKSKTLLLLAVLLVPLPLFAKVPAKHRRPVKKAEEAQMKAFTGSVKIRRAASKKWSAAKVGQVLKTNDQVKLGPASLAQVTLPSGVTLLVKENSHFSLKKDKQGRLVSFKVGEFLIGLKKKLSGTNRLRVQTPISVASVRGTVFWGLTDPKNIVTYACFTGSIEIACQGQKFLVQPGQSVTFAPKQKASPPELSGIPVDFINTFAINGSLEGLDALIEKESTANR